MKKLLLLTSIVLLSAWALNAQTLIEVPALDPAAGEYLNTYMENNPADGYILQRGEVYFVDATIMPAGGIHIEGKADPVETAPAIIAPMLRGDGTIANTMFNASGNLTLKNLYIISAGPQGQNQQQYVAEVSTDEARVVVDNCIFEANNEWGIIVYGRYSDCFVTNSVFRNNIQVGNYYCGRMLWTSAPTDTVEMVNNTCINSTAYFFTDTNHLTRYLRIEHNTLANILYTPFFLHDQINSDFKNNVFYNCHFMGQSNLEYLGNWDDHDGAHAAIISMDTLSATSDSVWNADNEGTFIEADRNVNVMNNVFGWDQVFHDFWNSADTLHGGYFMNARTEAMFADDVSYPHLMAENNLERVPSFTNIPSTDALINECNAFRQPGGPENVYWGFGNDLGQYSWPLPEDLSYSDQDLLSYGTDGKPVGDLRWFPDYVAVEKNEQVAITFSLDQNYPNPFNPSTVIPFSISKKSPVSLIVYNMLGQEVSRVVNNKVMNSGSHSVHFNASDLSSGVYFYQLQSNNITITKKMIFMK
jgi:hypothetical protein